MNTMSIPLTPGGNVDFNSFCIFNEKIRGPFKIVIKRVYENPTQDGVTPGKIVASDLTWYSPKQ